MPKARIRLFWPAGVEHAEAAAVIERIAGAGSPEEAARIGRGTERSQPLLLRSDWATAKLAVMYAGLRAKVNPRPSCLTVS